MKKLIKISFALALLPLCACSDWLDVGPKNQRSEKDLFSDGEGYETALNGIYQCLAEQKLYGQELTWGMVSAMGEEYKPTISSVTYQDAAKHMYKTTSTEPVVGAIWERMYKAIANCNNLIQNIQGADPNIFDYKEYEKNIILGEAYALRGMIHFDLLRLFAPAPIVAGQQKYIPYQEVHPTIVGMPLSVPDFMQKVIADLKRGKDLTAKTDTLPEYNDFIQSVSSRLEAYGNLKGFFGFRSTRLNYYVCTSLLARAYQYAGDSQNAIKQAKEMYDYFQDADFSSGHNYYSELWYSDINRRDLKSHNDILLALYNSREITFCRDYNEGGFGGRLLLRDPEGSFSDIDNEDDERYNYLFQEVKSSYGTVQGKASLKWYESTDDAIMRTIHPLIPLFRMAEIYYILAEETFDTDPRAAMDYLAEMRANRSINSTLTVPGSKKEFLKLIRNDAARELVGEGQMFFMMKRQNLPADEANIPTGATLNYVVPIPASNNVF